MYMFNYFNAWAFLEGYKGRYFRGEWPTLPEMFRITVDRYGDRPCLTIFEPDRVSLNYRETLARVQAVARWLYSKGIRKGDKAALTGKNSPEWAVTYLGVLFAGATIVPIDYQLKNEETDLLIKTSQAKILFVDEEKHPYYSQNSGLPDIVSLKKDMGLYVYDLDGPEAPIEEASEHDLAAILFTSGTTGEPKGVMLTHQNFVADCYLAQSCLHIYHTDIFYAVLPLHHSYCMLAVFIESIGVGAEVVFGKKMAPTVMLKELKLGKVTMFLGVPLLFNKVLAGILRGVRAKGIFVYGIIGLLMGISGIVKKVFRVNPGKKLFHSVLDKASLSTIRICISGGGPLAPSVFRKYNQLGIDFGQGYGLTETSPIINLNPIERYKETSVGKAVAQTEMKILEPDERGIGEVIVKGPMVMKGYFGMPDKTAEVFTADGFFKTGDLGYLDNENYLYLTGRVKNMIVTEGGKNVYPEEIENEFQLFDEIDQILIRGYIIDEKMKIEGIEALIYPNQELKDAAGQPFSHPEIKARMDAIVSEVNLRLLPYQKINRTVILDEAMEMTTTKKIKRDTV
jgi:long-chain acyl-CoA synthetase